MPMRTTSVRKNAYATQDWRKLGNFTKDQKLVQWYNCDAGQANKKTRTSSFSGG
jgi:hypothetical protein